MNGDPRNGLARRAWEAMSVGGRVASVLTLLGVVVVALSLWPFLMAVLGPSPKTPKAAADPQEHAGQQKRAFDGYLAQFNGRSLFIVPAAPAPPEPDKVAGGEPSKPPPPPSSYGGPAMVAMLSDVVWFSGGKKLKVGEKNDDVEVIALNPPWDARLKWKDVEFTVGLFDRSKLSKDPNAKPSASDATAAKPEDDKAVPTPTDAAKPADGKPGDGKPEEPKPRDPKPAGTPPSTPPTEGGRPGQPASAPPPPEPPKGGG